MGEFGRPNATRFSVVLVKDMEDEGNDGNANDDDDDGSCCDEA
jgi:hypothetical protein